MATPERGTSSSAIVDLAHAPRIQSVLRNGLWTLWAGATAVAVVGALEHEAHAVVAGAVLSLLTPLSLRLLSRGRARAAISTAICLVLGMSCLLLLTGGGIHDIAIVMFPAVSVLSALLLDRRPGQLFAAAVPACATAIGLAEYLGWVSTQFSSAVDPIDIFIVGLVLSAIGWITQQLASALHASVEQNHYREQAYREIFNASNEIIAIHDPRDGRIIDVNERATQWMGRSREELLAFSLADLAVGDGDQSAERALSLLRKASSEGPQVFDWRLTTKEGNLAWVEVSLKAAQILGRSRVIATVRDISERKLVESRLLVSERLHAVGQLAGGVAHDFNNQLTAIVSNASLLRRRLLDDPYALARLEAIMSCSNRSADLTRQLLAFARKHQSTNVSVDVAHLIAEVSSLLEHSVDKRIEVVHGPVDRGAWVMGDASLLQSAVLNLGLNARDAMPDGGRMTFASRLLPYEDVPGPARKELREPAERYVHISVRDTGHGMDAEVIDHIFEPFFTTKSQGVGMGLAAVYGTVQSHSGTVTVHSQPGSGTTVDLYLPATASRPAAIPAHHGDATALSLHVLLAEDDDQVARSTSELLKSFGCRVTRCCDGVSALETFQLSPSAYDVVLLDHAMPRMTGSDLASKMRLIRPEVPIIATSGYGEAFRETDQAERCVFLPKPFDLASLREAVDTAARLL